MTQKKRRGLKRRIGSIGLALLLAVSPAANTAAEDVILDEMEIVRSEPDGYEGESVFDAGAAVDTLENETEIAAEQSETEPLEHETEMAESAPFILDIEEAENPGTESDDVTCEVLESGAITLESSGDADQAARSRLRAGMAVYTDSYGAQLSVESKGVYDAMQSQWRDQKTPGAIKYTFKTAISFPVNPVQENGKTNWQLESNEEYQQIVRPNVTSCVQSAYDAFVYDYPDVFWLGAVEYSYSVSLNSSTRRGTIQAITVSMKSEKYAGASGEITAFEQTVTKEIENVRSYAGIGADATACEIVQAVHDYLCDTVSYQQNTYAWTAAGVFLKDRQVVCEGYAKAFKILCDRMGVETVLVPGSALKSNGNREGHMWNCVKMENGNWYLVDVTWDDQSSGIRHTYFLAGSSSQGFVSTISAERQIYNNFSGSVYAQSFGTPGISAAPYKQGAEPHTHDWKETIRTEATCQREGVAVYECACGAKMTETLNRIPHEYGAYRSNQDATCTSDGTKTAVCIWCGRERMTLPDQGSRLGHDYSYSVSNEDAACTQDGTKTETCSRCGAKRTVTDTGSALGHSFTHYVSDHNATVFADGTKTGHCERCGVADTVSDSGSRLKPTIVLNVSKLTLQVGQSTTKVKVTGCAAGDSVKSWKSSQTSVVKVSSTGKLTAQKKTGKASVTVTLASGVKKSIVVTVQKKAVKTTAIRSLPKAVTLTKGKTAKLDPVLAPITSREKITYASSDKKVATVSSKGVITARGAGTAKITVRSGNKKVTVKVTVRRTETKKISGVPKSLMLKKGSTKTLKAKRTPANSDEVIRYTSSNRKVATVSSKGKITAKKKGTTVITVKSGRISVKCKVTVKG